MMPSHWACMRSKLNNVSRDCEYKGLSAYNIIINNNLMSDFTDDVLNIIMLIISNCYSELMSKPRIHGNIFSYGIDPRVMSPELLSLSYEPNNHILKLSIIFEVCNAIWVSP